MNKRIYMVCHGNICRSPLAKFLLIKKLAEKKVVGIEVDSAGTSGAHAGQQPDARTMANALTHGLDTSSHRAKQFKSTDFAKFDRIYVMDSANYSDIMLLAMNEEDRSKVELFLEAAHPGSKDSVPDPWYGDEKGFEKVYNIIDKACGIIADKLKKGELP
jgi:protein-tyrosine phosphatase